MTAKPYAAIAGDNGHRARDHAEDPVAVRHEQLPAWGIDGDPVGVVAQGR